jgi:predicted DNA-binding transcriptional regulator AlpA
MTSYLDNLPSEVAAEIAMDRIVGSAEAAAFCGHSLPHWRRLYRAGRVPKPIKIGDRKYGWRLRTLKEHNTRKEAA